MGLTAMAARPKAKCEVDYRGCPYRRKASWGMLAALALLPVADALAQQGWRVQTNISASETWTDNVGRDGEHRSDWVTVATPSVSVSGQTARFSGRLGASLTNTVHASDESNNRTSLGLFGNGTLEMVEDHVFLDGATSISRQDLSLFGASSEGASYASGDNQTEVRTYTVSPHARFRLGSVGNLQMRYRHTRVESDAAALSASQSNDWSASLANGSAFGPLGWYVSTQANSADSGGETSRSSYNYRAGLTYRYVPDWQFQVFTGREIDDYGTGRRRATTSWGGGFGWTLSPQTSISASGSKHPFGWGYDVSLQRRFPRSSLVLGLSRGVSSVSSQGGSGLYAFSSQYAVALELERARIRAANPSLSDELVTQLAALVLFSRGISPELRQIEALYASYAVTRQVSAAWSLQGVRNTFALSASRARHDRLENGSYVGLGDFSTFSRITDSTLAAQLSHRLSPITSLTFLVSQTWASGSDVSGTTSSRRQTNLGVNLGTRFGARTNGMLAYRYVRASGSAEFTENSITASLTHTF